MLPSCPDVIPFTESTQFDRDLSRDKDNIILFVTHFSSSTLFYFHSVSSAGPASFGFRMVVEFYVGCLQLLPFCLSLLFMKRFFFTLLQSASLPDAPNLFFPPLFSFHRLRLSIRLVATCEQTARGTPRRTSGRVPATPRRLTLSIFRRVFAAVLAFVFFPSHRQIPRGEGPP